MKAGMSQTMTRAEKLRKAAEKDVAKLEEGYIDAVDIWLLGAEYAYNNPMDEWDDNEEELQ